MKLILKDGQELIITRANDTYSYEGYLIISWNRILILNVISSVPFIMKTSFSLKILMIYKVGVEALVIQ